ncbi:MAG TPA: hypothetical protein VHS78_19010 [Candidatus Elarobacter sp.]|jgi:hypothetical protein|nr:hypothetical protein [Candidatus Elarobacter sp.]
MQSSHIVAPTVSAPVAPDRNVTLSLSKGAPKPQDLAAAILFREILKPLADGLGPVGEIALGTVADDLFLRSRR